MIGFTHRTVGSLPLITVDAFASAGCFAAYTTRHGGVSLPPYDSLNLAFSPSREDPKENVEKNWKIVTHSLGCSSEQLIKTRQTHSSNVICVDRPTDFSADTFSDGVDGVVTERSDLLLSVVTADCQGLLMCDPIRKVYAAVHSGWRGTLADIAGVAIEKMERLGCRTENILISGGPSIQPCCFEVGEDLVTLFEQAWGQDATAFFTPTKTCGKFMGDLPAFTRMCLLRRGILPQNIHFLSLCSCCDTAFFSHRRQKGLRGTMASLIIGKECKTE